jgi:hypothetical protein
MNRQNRYCEKQHTVVSGNNYTKNDLLLAVALEGVAMPAFWPVGQK